MGRDGEMTSRGAILEKIDYAPILDIATVLEN